MARHPARQIVGDQLIEDVRKALSGVRRFTVQGRGTDFVMLDVETHKALLTRFAEYDATPHEVGPRLPSLPGPKRLGRR